MEEETDLRKQLESYLKSLQEEEKSPITIVKYQRDILRFLNFLEGKELTKANCLLYKAYLQAEGLHPNSINSMLVSLNGFLSFFGHPEFKLRLLKVQESVYCTADEELTRDEYVSLIAAAEPDKRLQLLIQTLGGTGIRVSELSYFTMEAVKKGEIRITCKNKIRLILIPQRLQEKLMEYAEKEGRETGSIFCTAEGKALNRVTIWRLIRRLCRKAGVPEEKGYPHNFR